VLLDEMYSPALADALRREHIEVSTVVAEGLAGRPDTEVFAAAAAGGYVVVTENVSDFVRIAAEHTNAGEHHSGVLIALSSRFSRRRSGIPGIVAAIRSLAGDELEDRIVFLELARP
jgi:Domain of unknown function (DUF5615)